VATLTGVTTTDALGTHTGVVVASFAGDTNYEAAISATGDLVVSQVPTSFSAVSGTAPLGGPAMLTATLISGVTNAGLSGEMVSFTLDGTSAGTATTDNNGVATVSNVATSDSAGTHSGVVIVTFAGDTDNSASNGTGDLIVS